MVLRSFPALHSGLPSVEALGGPVPASVPPLVGQGTGLGMGC